MAVPTPKKMKPRLYEKMPSDYYLVTALLNHHKNNNSAKPPPPPSSMIRSPSMEFLSTESKELSDLLEAFSIEGDGASEDISYFIEKYFCLTGDQ